MPPPDHDRCTKWDSLSEILSYFLMALPWRKTCLQGKTWIYVRAYGDWVIRILDISLFLRSYSVVCPISDQQVTVEKPQPVYQLYCHVLGKCSIRMFHRQERSPTHWSSFNTDLRGKPVNCTRLDLCFARESTVTCFSFSSNHATSWRTSHDETCGILFSPGFEFLGHYIISRDCIQIMINIKLPTYGSAKVVEKWSKQSTWLAWA